MIQETIVSGQAPVIGIFGAPVTVPMMGMQMEFMYASQSYCQAVERAGGIPLIIPAGGDRNLADRLVDRCDGILFPGGQDVDPRLYGEPVHSGCGNADIQTDRFWIQGLKHAMEKGLPILGICRGMQLINVGLGGSLYQDISEFKSARLMHSQKMKRSYPVHQVQIEPDSVLAAVLGTVVTETNSFHHQLVKELGKGLRITAKSEDGCVEAYESQDGMLLAVQWHPENLLDSVPCMNRLFQNLVLKAKENM